MGGRSGGPGRNEVCVRETRAAKKREMIFSGNVNANYLLSTLTDRLFHSSAIKWATKIK